jgi:hypothetical protein
MMSGPTNPFEAADSIALSHSWQDARFAIPSQYGEVRLLRINGIVKSGSPYLCHARDHVTALAEHEIAKIPKRHLG